MGALKQKFNRGLYFPFLIALILIAGTWSAGFVAYTYDGNMRTSLEQRASSIALALDTQSIIGLSGTADSIESPSYQDIKERLLVLKSINYDTSSLYLLTKDQVGNVVYLADSETPDTARYSAPGTVFDNANTAVKNIFDSREPIIRGPVRDSWGVWLSAFAPVIDPNTKQVIALIGIDASANDHYLELFAYAGIILLVSLGVSALAYAGNMMYHRERQLLTLRSEFVSVTSHDLLSPLAGIRWAAESMLHQNTTNLTVLQVRHIKSIHESSELLIETANDLLNISAIEAGRSEIMPRAFDLRRTLEAIASNHKLAMQSRGVKIVYTDSWPSTLTIWGDEDKLKRAFGNLLSNAIKYTAPDTAVTLGYELVDRMHTIHISDHGIGVPKDERQKIFRGFYRAKNAVGATRGTGMGLYLSRRLIEMHHGRIELESTENVGTTFSVKLPNKKIPRPVSKTEKA